MSHLEVNRQVRDWLNGTATDYAAAAQGIAVKLALLTSGGYKDAGDTLPSAPTVYDETRSAPVARGDVPAEPSVSVSIISSSVAATYMSQPPRIGEATVLIRYAAQNSDTDAGVTNAFYTLRAILMSLTELWKPENEAKRARNGVFFYPVEEVTYEPIVAQRESSDITFGLLLTLNTRSVP
jgi:hypothetical protein